MIIVNYPMEPRPSNKALHRSPRWGRGTNPNASACVLCWSSTSYELIKIREAFAHRLSESDMNNDVLLSMDRQNFGPVVLAERRIETYESCLHMIAAPL